MNIYWQLFKIDLKYKIRAWKLQLKVIYLQIRILIIDLKYKIRAWKLQFKVIYLQIRILILGTMIKITYGFVHFYCYFILGIRE